MPYYTQPAKPIDGDVIFAAHLNDESDATKTAFALVEADIDGLLVDVDAAVLRAQAWAEELVDVEVVPVSYSALHWATKSNDSYNLIVPLYNEVVTKHGEVSAWYDQVNIWQAEVDANATAAGISETNSGVSEVNALASEDKAHDWAEETEDIEVEIGEYSSHHWANKSEASALSSVLGVTGVSPVTVDNTDPRNPIVSMEAFEVENECINGTFDIWQRATSIGGTTSGYFTVDRWLYSAIGTCDSDRIDFPVGQTDVPGNPKYFIKEIPGGMDLLDVSFSKRSQRVLDVNKYSGKTLMISFYAKAAIAAEISIEGVQNFGSGGSTEVDSISPTKISLTTSWQKFNIPLTFPSISGKTVGTLSYTEINFWLTAGTDYNSRTDSLPLTDTVNGYDMAEIQFYISDIELPVRRRTAEEELALCLAYLRFLGVSGPVQTYPDISTSDTLRRKAFLMLDPPLIRDPEASYLSAGGGVVDSIEASYDRIFINATATSGANTTSVLKIKLEAEL